MIRWGLMIMVVVAGLAARADLIIHGAELGVGKFHRYDNIQHPYGAQNIWTPYLLPTSHQGFQSLTQKNADGSFTVFFTNLEELLTEVKRISDTEQQKVKILNIEAHGLPGTMWYPKNARVRDSMECYQWREFADGADADNYGQYYSAVSKSEILSIRRYAENANPGHQPCTVSLPEWTEVVNKISGFTQIFAADSSLHFVSCVVGLGAAGERFTKGLAQILFADGRGQVLTSINFGLGDWSMPEGMGFWDYQNDEQMKRDNAVYPKNRQDREIMQPGSVRLARATEANTRVVSNLQFVGINDVFRPQNHPQAIVTEAVETVSLGSTGPLRVRMPGTNVIFNVK